MCELLFALVDEYHECNECNLHEKRRVRQVVHDLFTDLAEWKIQTIVNRDIRLQVTIAVLAFIVPKTEARDHGHNYVDSNEQESSEFEIDTGIVSPLDSLLQEEVEKFSAIKQVCKVVTFEGLVLGGTKHNFSCDYANLVLQLHLIRI